MNANENGIICIPFIRISISKLNELIIKWACNCLENFKSTVLPYYYRLNYFMYCIRKWTKPFRMHLYPSKDVKKIPLNSNDYWYMPLKLLKRTNLNKIRGWMPKHGMHRYFANYWIQRKWINTQKQIKRNASSDSVQVSNHPHVFRLITLAVDSIRIWSIQPHFHDYSYSLCQNFELIFCFCSLLTRRRANHKLVIDLLKWFSCHKIIRLIAILNAQTNCDDLRYFSHRNINGMYVSDGWMDENRWKLEQIESDLLIEWRLLEKFTGNAYQRTARTHKNTWTTSRRYASIVAFTITQT